MEQLFKLDDGVYRPYTKEEVEKEVEIIEEMQKQQEQVEEDASILG